MKKSKPPLNARVNHMIERSNTRRKVEAQRKAERAEQLKRKAEEQLERARLAAEIEVIARDEARAKVVARGMDAMAESRASYDVDASGNCTPCAPAPAVEAAARPVPYVGPGSGMRPLNRPSFSLAAFVLIAASMALTDRRD